MLRYVCTVPTYQRQAIAMLARLNSSADTREQEVVACVVRQLFDEHRFFPNYLERELRIAGTLFGSLVRHRLVGAMTLGTALRQVLEALRCSPGPLPPDSSPAAGAKMFRFGMLALEQLKGRLGEWPEFCGEVLQIPHLVGGHPALVEEIERIMRGGQGSGGAAGGGGGGAITVSGRGWGSRGRGGVRGNGGRRRKFLFLILFAFSVELLRFLFLPREAGRQAGGGCPVRPSFLPRSHRSPMRMHIP